MVSVKSQMFVNVKLAFPFKIVEIVERDPMLYLQDYGDVFDVPLEPINPFWGPILQAIVYHVLQIVLEILWDSLNAFLVKMVNILMAKDQLKIPVKNVQQERIHLVRLNALNVHEELLVNITGATTPNMCYECPEGTYQPIEGANSSSLCIKCPAGYYSTKKGAINNAQCIPCPLGYYSTAIGATTNTTCLECPTGTYAILYPFLYDNPNGLGNETSCRACPTGTFNNQTMQTSCTNCIYSTYADQLSTINCKPCPSTYNTLSLASHNASQCVGCPPGKYSRGIHGCTSCPIGTASAVTTPGEIEKCVACVTGEYTNHTNTNVCYVCPDGSYSPNNTVCYPCDSGYYSPTSHHTSCLSCTPGTYAEKLSGSNKCIDCPAGYYQPNYTAIWFQDCIVCPDGYISKKGAPICDKCDPGFYMNKERTRCVQCPTGTFTNATVNPSIEYCLLCPTGTYAPNKNSSACLICDEGECTRPGSSVRISKEKVSTAFFEKDLSIVHNPQLLVEKEKSEDMGDTLIRFVTLGVVAGLAVTFILLALCVTLLCRRPILSKLDMLFSMKHRIEPNDPLVKRKTNWGGVITIAAGSGVLILFAMSLADFIYQNTVIKEVFQETVDNPSYPIGQYQFEINLFGSYNNCYGFYHRVSGLGGDYQESCTFRDTFEGQSDLPHCHCAVNCTNCGLEGITQYFEIRTPVRAISNVISYAYSVPFYLPDTQFRVNGTVVPDQNTVFYGQNPTTIFVNVYYTTYRSQTNYWDFITPGDPDYVKHGFQTQLQTISKGSMAPAATLTDDDGFVAIRIQYNLAAFMFKLTEELKQSTLNFVAQISSLASMVLSISAVILGVGENFGSKLKKLKDKIMGNSKDIENQVYASNLKLGEACEKNLCHCHYCDLGYVKIIGQGHSKKKANPIEEQPFRRPKPTTTKTQAFDNLLSSSDMSDEQPFRRPKPTTTKTQAFDNLLSSSDMSDEQPFRRPKPTT
eukprot:CAMPEP_0117425514 /NCGR_PEP_ID=MMETSP0758-20121206/5783_1 /TAXON_ID=63605 /ORGANISM="Percolomonas cosmopolitus, Strain AE-1 (ATCC 50343)" /LENGTH=973 /DNA_ID=CAMNT_0005210069 /DNA_START=1566 /DNA_END=4482 /DNA_ORIENTATION=+